MQAVVRRSTIVGLLGDDRPRTLAVAAGLGAASSSCSYAAVALAKSLFRKGANFTAAMAFEIGSTALVVELGIILALLMGWQFTAAEFVGGPLMIMVLALLFRLFVRQKLIDAAREQAEQESRVRWKAMLRRGVPLNFRPCRGRERAQMYRDAPGSVTFCARSARAFVVSEIFCAAYPFADELVGALS